MSIEALLGLVGFITVGGGPLFLVFYDVADRGMNEKITVYVEKIPIMSFGLFLEKMSV